MNNLCNELSFYKLVIPEIKLLLNYIKQFTLVYKEIRNTYLFETNEFYNLVSQEYIKNNDLVIKFENLFEDSSINSIISLCNQDESDEIIEGFDNTNYETDFYKNDANQYCDNYSKLLLLFLYIDKVVKKANDLRFQFSNNNSETDSLITNYSDIIEKGTTFLEIVYYKIKSVQKNCKLTKMSDKDKKIIITAVIVILTMLILIIILQIIQKNKKVNLIISDL